MLSFATDQLRLRVCGCRARANACVLGAGVGEPVAAGQCSPLGHVLYDPSNWRLVGVSV